MSGKKSWRKKVEDGAERNISNPRTLEALGLKPVILALLAEGKGPEAIAHIITEDTNSYVSTNLIQHYIDSLRGGTLPLMVTAQQRQRAMLQAKAADWYRQWEEQLIAAMEEPEMAPYIDRKTGHVLMIDGEPHMVQNEARLRKIELLSKRQLEWYNEQLKFHELDKELTKNITNIVINPVQVIVESVRSGKMSAVDADAIVRKLGGDMPVQ